MSKYYKKVSEVVKAKQWNGTPIRGVTIRDGKGYITINKGLYVLDSMDWILTHEDGSRSILKNEEFIALYEFDREDEYEDDADEKELILYKEVEYEAVFEYKPEDRKRRKNASKKGSTAGNIS
jgi:hypothetical protein